MSKRKPFNDLAGYIASRRNTVNRGWVVLYLAEAQGIDADGRKYAVVCETHHTIAGATSVANARPMLAVPDFCESCMAAVTYPDRGGDADGEAYGDARADSY